MLPAPAQLRPQLPALGGAAGRCPRPQMWPPVPRPPSCTITALPTPPWRWCPTEVLDFGRTRTFPLPKSLNLYLYRRSLGVSERAGPSGGGLVLGPAGRTCWQPPWLWLSPGELCHQNFPRVSPWFLPSWVNWEEIWGGFGSEVAPLALMRSGTFGLTLESARLGFASQRVPQNLGCSEDAPGVSCAPVPILRAAGQAEAVTRSNFGKLNPRKAAPNLPQTAAAAPKPTQGGLRRGARSRGARPQPRSPPAP